MLKYPGSASASTLLLSVSETFLSCSAVRLTSPFDSTLAGDVPFAISASAEFLFTLRAAPYAFWKSSRSALTSFAEPFTYAELVTSAPISTLRFVLSTVPLTSAYALCAVTFSPSAAAMRTTVPGRSSLMIPSPTETFVPEAASLLLSSCAFRMFSSSVPSDCAFRDASTLYVSGLLFAASAPVFSLCRLSSALISAAISFFSFVPLPEISPSLTDSAFPIVSASPMRARYLRRSAGLLPETASVSSVSSESARMRTLPFAVAYPRISAFASEAARLTAAVPPEYVCMLDWNISARVLTLLPNMPFM